MLEALAFGEQRWWSIDDLLGAGLRTIPYRLGEFLPDLLAGAPDSPIDITPEDHHVASWQSG